MIGVLLAAALLASGGGAVSTEAATSSASTSGPAEPRCEPREAPSIRPEIDAAQVVARVLEDPRLQIGDRGPSALEPLLRALASWLRQLLSLPTVLGAVSGARGVFLLLMMVLLTVLLVFMLRQLRGSPRRATRPRPVSPAEVERLRLSLADARGQLARQRPLEAMRTGIQVLDDVLVRSRQLDTARTLTPLEQRDTASLAALDLRTDGAAGRALSTYQRAVLARQPLGDQEVDEFLRALEATLAALQRPSAP